MKFGALIAAAGMSSRMGRFKPMLNIGSISISQRIVANFKQAGIDLIAMVTGYNAPTLEKHLTGNGIVFLRNDAYEHTEMFDSVKIGLSYLRDRCDALLFTPIDIPLFTCETVEALMNSQKKLACPVCDGQTGHPILISTDIVDEILRYSGEQGLRGAWNHCSVRMEEVPVFDKGILYDADTPDDYSALLQYHNSQLCRPEVTVALNKERVFLDARVAMLLSQINETQSVRESCERMQISYSTGWNIIRTLEAQLECPLVLRNQGGSGGSTSELSERCKLLLERFYAYRGAVRDYAEALYETYFGDLL